MDIAFIQNSIGIGGRSKVLAEAIKSLAEPDTEIGLFTLSETDSMRKFIDYYEISKYDFNTRKYPKVASLFPGTLYQQLALNWVAKSEIEEHDLVFNSNNSLRFLPNGPRYIHYIHLPIPAIPETNHRYRSSLIHRLYALPVKAVQHLTNSGAQEGTAFTNSRFTARQYEQVYGTPPDGVLYPPAIESVSLESFSGEGVVSLGSFHPNKRQLFQIKVAEKLPDISFTIMGNTASAEYYDKCARYVDENNIDNVTLRQDASADEVHEKLQESKIFLHSMQNEPFGISTVEALNAGCIPVTHDSGGQQEIVPDARFRYTSKSECINAIRLIENGRYTLDVSETRPKLENYTASYFRTRLQECVTHV